MLFRINLIKDEKKERDERGKSQVGNERGPAGGIPYRPRWRKEWQSGCGWQRGCGLAADWLRIGCRPRGAPDGRGVSASQTLAGPYWISRADSKGIQYLSIVSPLHPTASGWMAFISLIDQSRSLPNNQRPDQSRLPGPRPVSCGPETGPPLQGTGTQTGGRSKGASRGPLRRSESESTNIRPNLFAQEPAAAARFRIAHPQPINSCPRGIPWKNDQWFTQTIIARGNSASHELVPLLITSG
jgi:hypothetical protein